MTATQLKYAAIVGIAAAIPIAFQWNQNSELKDRLSEMEMMAGDGGEKAPPTTKPAPATKTVESAKVVKADQTNSRLEELEKIVADLRDKVVVDLGTVEDIGAQMAEMLLSRTELAKLRAISPADRTDSEKQRLLELERQEASALGVLPEIAGFQDDPEQYGRFFSALLHDAAGLDEARTAAVYDYMKGRGEAMVASGLNAAKEPADPLEEEEWEESRDEFNSGTASGVAGLLAPGEAERIGFSAGFLELLEQDFDKADEIE
jgi:anti-anti-sigma regulatory factor